jgi:hypothetical protein
MISRRRSAPTAFAMSMEWTTSANKTVTCLYSATLGACVTGESHSSQNLAATRIAVAPHVVHGAAVMSPPRRHGHRCRSPPAPDRGIHRSTHRGGLVHRRRAGGAPGPCSRQHRGIPRTQTRAISHSEAQPENATPNPVRIAA